MSFSDKFSNLFKTLLPAPFTIAVGLTAFTFWMAVFFGTHSNSFAEHTLDVLSYWENGLWNNGLLVFAMQMMLMLVLGHALALSQHVNKLISKIVVYCNNTAKAAAIVTFSTVIISLFNWGLGLIFGAIFARKVAEHVKQNNFSINYPLIGAAGYSGLMVWHGGLSGSAPIKVAESGHFLEAKTGIISQSETIFSSMNITVSLLLLIILPTSMYIIGKRSKENDFNLSNESLPETQLNNGLIGAEKIDHSKYAAYLFGGIVLFYALFKAFILPEELNLNFITPNYINFVLFGLAITFHGSFFYFLKAIDNAIGGASGILIQFPLYFGIMGIMKESGLINMLSDFFVSVSNETTFPILTLVSSGIVNIFVPSGGGQWAVQGPIIVDAANQLGVSLPKSIMALAYGDQLTNMLQPFWALPLLGITGLKAKEILPYTIYLMLIGGVIYLTGLILF